MPSNICEFNSVRIHENIFINENLYLLKGIGCDNTVWSVIILTKKLSNRIHCSFEKKILIIMLFVKMILKK